MILYSANVSPSRNCYQCGNLRVITIDLTRKIIDLPSPYTQSLPHILIPRISFREQYFQYTVILQASIPSSNGFRMSVRSTPTSVISNSLKVLMSLRYTHSPPPVPSFEFCPSLTTTQSYRLGPEMGELSQICLLGGCLLIT